MIGYLNGNVISYDEGTVILEVNGVGFEIFCSSSVYNKLIKDGKGEVYVYTAVREDGISLYGFISKEEKKAFLGLISVSGVGPKMGIAVLSQMTLDELTLSIATSNVKALSSVKGMGKKTAERIILELKEKVSVNCEDMPKSTVSTGTVKANQDAVVALMSLGFNKSECERAVIEAEQNGNQTLEKIISYALKNIK